MPALLSYSIEPIKSDVVLQVRKTRLGGINFLSLARTIFLNLWHHRHLGPENSFGFCVFCLFVLLGEGR